MLASSLAHRGAQSSDLELNPGTAWFADSGAGQVSLLDGGTASRISEDAVAVGGQDIRVVQSGTQSDSGAGGRSGWLAWRAMSGQGDGPDHVPDFPEYAMETTGVWDAVAEWWDDTIGDGNATQDLLVEPAQERLLALEAGDQVLDIACGAGRFTRRMAAAGAQVVAFDHSERFIARARERTPPQLAERVDYRVLNADDTSALLALGDQRFDAVVCTMALMDMARITPLLSVLPRLLRADGRFVFSVTHPVFNSGDARLVAEALRRDRSFVTEISIQVTDYLTPRMQKDVSVAGQPVEQHYFHRPLGLLLNTCFDHGFVLDRIEEPALPPSGDSASQRSVSWANVNRLPQVFVARLKLQR
jgi:ubiquinone/menaquinone biosynthesis C-methylase UbiE